MKRQPKIILGIVLILVFLFSSVILASPAKWFSDNIQQTLKKDIIKIEVWISPQLNKLDIGFGKHEGIKYYFVKSINRIFFQNKDVLAEVKNIVFDNNAITLKLYNDILGSGKITYRFKEQQMQSLTSDKLRKILLTTLSDKSHSRVYCDTESKICHVYSCNHLPDRAIPMTIENAERDGYRKCNVCFRKVLYLPNIGLEYTLRDEMMRRFNHMVLDDLQKQKYLQSLVNSILVNWPFKLIGYNYSVKIIKSNRPKSFAICGIIYIGSSLMDSVNNEEELEAILVREIAHVERRHAIRKYVEAVKTAQNSQALAIMGAAMGGMAGAAAASGDSRPSTAFGISSAMFFAGSVGMSISIQGYGKKCETEADSIANLYFRINKKSVNNLLNIVKRDEFTNLLEHKKTNIYTLGRSDPYLEERIERIANTRFKYFGEQERYVLKRKKNYPVQLNLNYQEMFKNDNKLIVYINDSEFLHEYISNFDKELFLLITDENGEQKFETNRNTLVRDVWGCYLTFERIYPKRQKVLLGDIRKISLVIHDKEKKEDVEEFQRFQFSKGNIEF